LEHLSQEFASSTLGACSFSPEDNLAPKAHQKGSEAEEKYVLQAQCSALVKKAILARVLPGGLISF
jgi:hypothetical protein